MPEKLAVHLDAADIALPQIEARIGLVELIETAQRAKGEPIGRGGGRRCLISTKGDDKAADIEIYQPGDGVGCRLLLLPAQVRAQGGVDKIAEILLKIFDIGNGEGGGCAEFQLKMTFTGLVGKGAGHAQ